MTHTAWSLAVLAHEETRDLADLLGWTVANGRYALAVTEAARLVGGSDDPADAADTPRLEAAVVVAALRRMRAAAAARYDLALDGQTLNRSQVVAGIGVALAEAERRLAELGGGAALLVGRWRIPDDTYRYLPDDLRTPA